MNLSEHFTFEEFCRTSNAKLQSDNRMQAAAFVTVLGQTAKLLEVVRCALDCPLVVHSAFRSAALNGATAGSSKTSQHPKGEAVDFSRGKETKESIEGLYRRVLDILREGGVMFGQCILESRGAGVWIHLSLGFPFRDLERCYECFTMVDGVRTTPITTLGR